MSSAVRYQVMPPLSSEEYQELHDDIKVNGVLEPIHVDEEGVVIDGHHRSKIANELGIVCPVITHDDLDDVGKRSLAFTLNLKRRHLNREQRRALIAESLKLDPMARDAEHAKRTGADPKTVKRIREEVQIPQPSEAIAEYVEQHPEKSNREVARDLGVSHVTVGAASGQKREFPENDHPSTKPVNADDLDALNAQLPTEQPTMEKTMTSPTKTKGEESNRTIERNRKETPDGYILQGMKNTRRQLDTSRQIVMNTDSIIATLEAVFPHRTFDLTFTREEAGKFAQSLQDFKKNLDPHIKALNKYSKGVENV